MTFVMFFYVINWQMYDIIKRFSEKMSLLTMKFFGASSEKVTAAKAYFEARDNVIPEVVKAAEKKIGSFFTALFAIIKVAVFIGIVVLIATIVKNLKIIKL